MACLISVFPVVHVNGLQEVFEACEHGGLTDMSDLILNSAGEAFVELVPEHSIAPLDPNSEPIEFDNILCDMLTVFHMECLEVSFGIHSQVVWAKVILECLNKVSEVI